MTKGNDELILLALGSTHLFKTESQMNVEKLYKLIGVEKDTLVRYINILRKKDLVKRIETGTLTLTENGRAYYEKVLDDILDYDLIPERHSVSRICKFRILIPQLKSLEAFMKTIISVRSEKAFDVLELMQTMSAMEPDSEERLRIDELYSQSKNASINVEETYPDLSMLGIRQNIVPTRMPLDDIPGTLILADIKRRRDKVEEAFYMFHTLRSDNALDPGHWIVAVIGCIFCIRSLKGPETALHEIGTLSKRIHDPAHKAMLLYAKADILSDMEDFKASTRYYRSSIGIMNATSMPRTKIEVLNSLGVHYYRQGKFSLAERTWRNALNSAKRFNLPWISALLEINLADCYSRRGNHRTAWNKIKRSEKVLLAYGDQEGLADINYNKSLLSVRQGKMEEAYRYFEEAEKFPLAYSLKKEEWKKVFSECLVENGYPPFTRDYIRPHPQASEKPETV